MSKTRPTRLLFIDESGQRWVLFVRTNGQLVVESATDADLRQVTQGESLEFVGLSTDEPQTDGIE